MGLTILRSYIGILNFDGYLAWFPKPRVALKYTVRLQSKTSLRKI